jgi:hypothetical protein
MAEQGQGRELSVQKRVVIMSSHSGSLQPIGAMSASATAVERIKAVLQRAASSSARILGEN